jgi:hypothetical protein
MNLRLHPARLFLTLSLLLFLVASCAPAAVTETQPPVESAPLLPSATPLQSIAPTADAPTQDPSLAQPATQAPLPIATSRGPDLHATDPATVSLASGQYQFVEFFRFT